MNTHITSFLTSRANSGYRTCGETGLLQTSGWDALDAGISYEEWCESVLAVLPVASDTLRIQFRKMEQDRNACLADDGLYGMQTFYGKRVHG